jgi:hypothetical protein
MPVREGWVNAIEDFESRLVLSKSRSRVKAARDLGEVSEGLRIVVRIFSVKLLISILTLTYTGSNQTTGILSGSLPAHSGERHY